MCVFVRLQKVILVEGLKNKRHPERSGSAYSYGFITSGWFISPRQRQH